MAFEKRLKLKLQSVFKPTVLTVLTQENEMIALRTERTEDNQKCKVDEEIQVKQRIIAELIECLTIKEDHANQNGDLQIAKETSIITIQKTTMIKTCVISSNQEAKNVQKVQQAQLMNQLCNAKNGTSTEGCQEREKEE